MVKLGLRSRKQWGSTGAGSFFAAPDKNHNTMSLGAQIRLKASLPRSPQATTKLASFLPAHLAVVYEALQQQDRATEGDGLKRDRHSVLGNHQESRRSAVGCKPAAVRLRVPPVKSLCPAHPPTDKPAAARLCMPPVLCPAHPSTVGAAAAAGPAGLPPGLGYLPDSAHGGR
eukprot:902501-Pelagomonas_calceolata.AAC.5